MLARDAQFSGPRFVFVTEAELEKLDASPGMYAYVASTPGSLASDRVVQRVGGHWEIVAEPLIGAPAGGGEDPLIRATPAPFGSGSGVAVAPRNPGDPSVTDPMVTTLQTAVSMPPDPMTDSVVLADGVQTTLLTWTVPGGFIPHTVAFLDVTGTMDGIMAAGDAVDLELVYNGGVIAIGQYATTGGSSWVLIDWAATVPSVALHPLTGGVFGLRATYHGAGGSTFSWDWNDFENNGLVTPYIVLYGVGS